jgi:hypothetical protein
MGGKRSKGKETGENANTIPVQKQEDPEGCRTSDYPARIRGSNQASNPDQKRGLTSKPAQERSHGTLSRKHSQEQDATTRSGGEYEHPKGYDPSGHYADPRTRALGIPGLRLQQRRCAAHGTFRYLSYAQFA